MRTILRNSMLIVLACSWALTSWGQNPVIQVSRNKNTYLIITGTVADIPDIGGDSVVAWSRLQSRSDTMNLYKLKARRDNFATTNMLLPCADTIFEFTVMYHPDPANTRPTFRFTGARSTAAAGQLLPSSVEGVGEPQGEMVTNGVISVPAAKLQALRERRRNINVSSSANRLVFLLDNIGSDPEHHYFKFRIRNNSPVPYTIDYLKFIVESKGKKGIGNRAAVLTQSNYPTYVEAPGNAATIGPGEQQELLYALELLPLSEGEQLTIVMQERSANSKGRSLTLNVRPSVFKKIIPL